MRYRKSTQVKLTRDELIQLLTLKGIEMPPPPGPGPVAGINIHVLATIHSHDQKGELVELDIEASWTTESTR